MKTTMNNTINTITRNDVIDGKDKDMILEVNRLKSFKSWPFRSGNCTKYTVSVSGFYHCNIDGEVDGVRCFCCFKELDGWDTTDNPQIEHKRNNNCYFANLGKPESQLTVKEFLKVMEEREVNLMNLRIETMNEMEKLVITELGLKIDDKIY
ncbi:baculoviral IAP repeat-containing protein 5-like [Oppia nitens]|uniref:baculoviral IAP repeat-containing protein 5-like n=1 Tax=Oppia nitens TaxID=1686743 RepID=UPI0023D99C59|nr:baculoviral IAP repeat-containing protein 5-like [Oppia nitens]